ncbi:PPE family protein [Mycobacterium sp. HUMS_1102779]|uniref:PPE family protein n=1 Tax=Mycobacterium sp. HUMS_1102779 TaxID=3383487 RepID=UPI00389B10CD
MLFGLLPPEINSGRMYSGPGSGPMVAAAESWDALAAQLHATAASYSSVISGLATAWQGPSAVSMASAAAPYAAWMSATAAQAEQAAAQARNAAAAYEAAFAATVPPAVVAANRSELAFLVATNIFGQNTAAIAATEAQYSRMWAQDASAMTTYAAQSAAVSTVTPFSAPPATTAAGALAPAANFISSAQTELASAFGAVPAALQSLGAVVTGPNPAAGLLTALQEFAGLQTLSSLSSYFEDIGKLVLPVNVVFINTIFGLVSGARHVLDVGAAAGGAESAALAAGLGSVSPLANLAGVGAVSAGVGQAGLVGGVSVPPSWATATPAIRTVAAVLSGAGMDAVPAAAVSEGTWLSGTALAGMAGGALGAAVPGARSGADARLRSTSLKDGASKGGETPANLQRLVAEMAEKPDDVQHWYTESAELESLVAKLRKKPGIHAVHLTDGDMNVRLPRPE